MECCHSFEECKANALFVYTLPSPLIPSLGEMTYFRPIGLYKRYFALTKLESYIYKVCANNASDRTD